MTQQTAILSENYCLDATVTATHAVTLSLDFQRQIYAAGGLGVDEPYKDRLTDYRPDRPFRTRKMAPVARFSFDFGANKTVRLLAVLGHNLTPAGRILLELSTASDFSTIAYSTTITPTSGQSDDILVLPGDQTARYLRVTAIDMTLDWLEIGLVVAGNPTVLDRSVSVGAEDAWNDPSMQSRTDGGGMNVTAKQSFREVSIPFDLVSTTEKDAIYTTIGNSIGRHAPIMVLRNWDTGTLAYAGWWIYGLLTRNVAHRSVQPMYWAITLDVTELKGRPSAGAITQNLQITVSPSSIDFADTQVTATTDETLTVTNQSSSTGTLSGLVSVTGTGFSIVGTRSFSLAAGASASFTVRFAPTTTGEKSGTLSVQHAAFNAASPVEVALTGTATAAPVYDVWNAAGTDANITLSNGNLTATMNATPGGGKATRTQTGRDTGYFYVEFTVANIASSAADLAVGLIDTNQTPNGELGDLTYGYAWRLDGYKENAGTASAYGSAATGSDVIMMAFKLYQSGGADVADIYFGLNGSWFGSSDPATETSPAFSAVTAALATDFLVACTMKTSGDSITANFGASTFAHTVPAGFGAGWGQNIS